MTARTDAAGQATLYQKRNAASPFLLEVNRDVSALGVSCWPAARRSSAAPLAVQLLGYLDGEGHGAAGLEAAFDELLTGSGAGDTLLCTVNAQGKLRAEPVLTPADSGAVGVQLTLSREIQQTAEAVANDTASGLPEGAAVEALAGGVTEPEYGEITRGDLMAALPATARIQLVSIPADTAKTLADSGSVSRVYQSSLTEYTPAGDTAYIVTDTATLAALNADYTVLRDYGDVFWAVRMNINDLTNNFAENFTLPEAPQYGVGRKS